MTNIFELSEEDIIKSIIESNHMDTIYNFLLLQISHKLFKENKENVDLLSHLEETLLVNDKILFNKYIDKCKINKSFIYSKKLQDSLLFL